MSRLIWLAGSSGAGTTTFAALTADLIAAEGRSVAVVDVTGGFVPDPPVSDLAPLGQLAAALGRVGWHIGAEPVVPELWQALPEWELLKAWSRILTARNDAEVVIVDGGSFVRTRDLISFPGVLLRLLDAALTPRAAMWRSMLGEGIFDELSDTRQCVLGWQRVIDDPDVSARLLARPEPRQAQRMLRAAAGLALRGVHVEGMAISPYPRKKEPWPDHVRAAAEQALAIAHAGAEGAQVWRCTSRRRVAPRGFDVVGPWGTAGGARTWRSGATPLKEHGDGYVISIPVRGPARAEGRLGVTSGDLVIDFDGSVRWWDLPPVLQRCRLVDAQRDEAGWHVYWSPDPSVWPQNRGRAEGESVEG